MLWHCSHFFIFVCCTMLLQSHGYLRWWRFWFIQVNIDIWYNQLIWSTGLTVFFNFFLLEDSFATRRGRFLSSVWREFTKVQWISCDNALIVQTSRNFLDDRIVDQWKVVSQSPPLLLFCFIIFSYSFLREVFSKMCIYFGYLSSILPHCFSLLKVVGKVLFYI